MKYVYVSIAAMIIVFGTGYLLAHCIVKRSSGTHKGAKTAGLTVLIGCALMVIISLLYFGDCSRADERARTALLGSESVTVSAIDGGYLFDGPSFEKAIIFYPGAKVECEAYAPLMLKLAETDFDCFLTDMPFNFAMFGGNAAEKFLNNYSYDTWLMAGHSMGGIMAAAYAEKDPDRIDGVILLAAYTTAKLDDRFQLCSVYGSEDGELEQDVYNNNKGNWPKNFFELVIEGGNHAQFGDYGVQKSDGTATISAEEQQRITAEAISGFFQ